MVIIEAISRAFSSLERLANRDVSDLINPRELRIKQYMKALLKYRQRNCNCTNTLQTYNSWYLSDSQKAEEFLKMYTSPKDKSFPEDLVIPEEVIDRTSGIARLNTPVLVDMIHSEMPFYGVDDTPTSNVYAKVGEIEGADNLDEDVVAGLAFVISSMGCSKFIYSMVLSNFPEMFGTLQDRLQEAETFAFDKVAEFYRNPDSASVLREQLDKWKESEHYSRLLESD